MSFSSRLVNWLMKLPPVETYDIVVTRDLQIPMPDGVVLLADHYAPRRGSKQPTVLMRSPYGRRGFFGSLAARPYAERGYQVLIQSCRGTAGSGGAFVYARYEREDGLATVEWLKQQEWFNGELAMVGASYLGFVQWAVAAEAGPELKAIVPHVTTSDFNHFRFQGGSFTLETSLDWSTNMTMERLANFNLKTILETRKREQKLKQAYVRLPLQTADRVVIDQPSRSFQNNIAYAPEDDYWKAVDHSPRLKELTVPASFIAGWYDLFLFWQLKDFRALRETGQRPHLLIGPWTHGDLRGAAAATREGLAWLNAYVQGDTGG
ncbi:MAG TPA: CocE/NonD family hydrolase [Ktedonobacteraceae bacterium]